MPTTPARAGRWVDTGKVTPFWKRGIWCVRLNQKPSDTKIQKVVIGLDPGSKMHGITVASTAHTYLNVQAHAKDGQWIKDKMEARYNARHSRRFRTTPYRQCRRNRAKSNNWIPPSTKARWQWLLNLTNEFAKSFPITDVVIEDVKARVTKGSAFNPVQAGKNFLYTELRKRYTLHTYEGWETANMRNVLGLEKDLRKLETNWNVHCVDSYCLCYWQTACKLDNQELMVIKPLKLYRRQLHVFQPSKGGNRREYGGTRSMGISRGTLVNHPKHGLSYVGGTSNSKVSLHNMNGKRLCQNAKPLDLKIKTKSTYVSLEGVASRRGTAQARRFPPRPKGAGFLAPIS